MSPRIQFARLTAMIVIICSANSGICEITPDDDYEERHNLGMGARMVEGIEAPRHAYPFLVVMQVRNGSVYVGKCNGILIDADTILMPAITKCLTVKAEQSRALAGTYDSENLTEHTRQIRDVCFTEVYQSHSRKKSAYMFAHLSEPFHLNEYVRTVALPRMKNVAKVDGECIAAGRFDSTGKILHKSVKIRPCKQPEYKDKTIICTDYGPCRDTGGALVCTRGNREFVAAQYLSSSCSNDHDTAYTSFLAIDYKWLDEMKKKAVQKCRSYE